MKGPDKPTLIQNPPFPRNYATEFLLLERGRGCWLWDAGGKRYLDLGSGIAVNHFGYGDRALARIAHRQMKRLTHVSNLYTTTPAVELARRLVATGPFQAVHFGNSGAEANEAAIKYARAWALREKGSGHHEILAFENAFHGRTMGALSVTATEKYRKPFEPLVPGVKFAQFNNLDSIQRAFSDRLAAVIVEPIQGEGGLMALSAEAAAEIQRLCERHGVLLIVDEVQTGLGRTGRFWAHTELGLRPDIACLSKPLAGGLPLSATLINEKVNSRIQFGDHGTTFGGGPVTTAVALEVVRRVQDEGFLEKVRQRGLLLRELLSGLVAEGLGVEIRGRGLLQGLVLPRHAGQDPPLADILVRCRDEGLLVLRSGADVLRIAPPLIIEPWELEKGVGILRKVLRTFYG